MKKLQHDRAKKQQMRLCMDPLLEPKMVLVAISASIVTNVNGFVLVRGLEQDSHTVTYPFAVKSQPSHRHPAG